MDQFCMSENESGGRCSCSAGYGEFEGKIKAIEKNNAEAVRIESIEVEKVQAGADADILFGGDREYDSDGNVVRLADKEKQKQKPRRVNIDSLLSEDGDEDGGNPFDGLTGKNLYDAAREVCLEQVEETCSKSGTLSMHTSRYMTLMKSDCAALSKNVGEMLRKSELAVLMANKAVVEAKKSKFDEVNEYNRGECMVEFKKCMKTDNACGSGWENCAASIAEENMQNNRAKSTAGTKVVHTEKFWLADSTKEMLSSKRNICERVLNKCDAVRNFVWEDFLRDVAPEVKIAESKLESNMRQSCLATISTCIQKACKDDIAGKGAETMDSCLARPELARSFCKPEIDPCERMDANVWDYVKDKLAAMRVDACTNEVKECFTSDDRCGADFSNCIGMDYKYLHDLCPIDKLLVCRQGNKDFQMSDIDNMLMGFYLNVDNSMLDLCQAKVEQKMGEICGSTTDCNAFAADDVVGTGSLQDQKVGALYRITGMLSFGSIKVGNGSVCDGVPEGEKCDSKNRLPWGRVGVADYIAGIKEANKSGIISDPKLFGGVVSNIESELENISGTINRTIDMIASDPEIQYCVDGRDLSQINGGGRGKANKTTARFPNLLNSLKTTIAAAALRQAQTNYNKKFEEAVKKASKGASADIAQFMCQKIASGGAVGNVNSNVDTELFYPFSIIYSVGAGLTIEQLTSGGYSKDVSASAEFSTKNTTSNNIGAAGGAMGAAALGVAAVATGGTALAVVAGAGALATAMDKPFVSSIPGGTMETTALFNRDTRICHITRVSRSRACKNVKKNGFFGIGGEASQECGEEKVETKTEDIPL
jgi:hypothetical protein